MVLYFSGTGNSRHIAEIVAERLGETLFDIGAAIKSGETAPAETGENLIIAAPVYAYRLPLPVADWLAKAGLSGAKRAWFIMTCGSNIANAGKYNRALCGKMGVEYMGTFSIKMPENYIAMFSAPKPEKAKRIVADALPRAQAAADFIARGEAFPKPAFNPLDSLLSGAVNAPFYRLYVKADAFCATDACVGCGLCEKLCVLNNITVENGRPVWGKRCTHCMACISYCPKEAIEYGRITRKKRRYRIETALK